MVSSNKSHDASGSASSYSGKDCLAAVHDIAHNGADLCKFGSIIDDILELQHSLPSVQASSFSLKSDTLLPQSYSNPRHWESNPISKQRKIEAFGSQSPWLSRKGHSLLL
ncbi:hypothetical protein ACLB2K_046659 [Fragaria x ananassa]